MVVLALVAYEFRLRRRSLLGWSILIILYLGLLTWAWRAGARELGEVYEQIISQYPEEFIKLFAKEVPRAFRAEAFYVIEYFVFAYVMALGAYVSYLGAGLIVDDVLERTGSLVLSMPISRRGLLASRFLSLLLLSTSISLASLATTVAIYGALGAHEDFRYSNIALLHLNGVFYLATCAALGVLVGAILPFHLAKPAVAGLALLCYVVDVMTAETSLEVIGYLAPSRYIDVMSIAVEGSLSSTNLAVSAVLTALLLLASIPLYERKDLPV